MHWKAVPGQLDIILSSPSLRLANLRHFWWRAITLIMWNVYKKIFIPRYISQFGLYSKVWQSCFPSLLWAVVAWLSHWARGRFREQTQQSSAWLVIFAFAHTVLSLSAHLVGFSFHWSPNKYFMLLRHRFLLHSRWSKQIREGTLYLL